MPLFRRFFLCFSLRSGALTIAYSGLVIIIIDSICTIYNTKFCGEIKIMRIISTIWNVLSEIVLLTAVYRENPNLLPVHLVTCLCGLILEMSSHMIIAGIGLSDSFLIGYAFFAIGYVSADLMIVLSYYHSEV
ncbi:uncharacterized protein LOC108105139 [Drosophila eugracilis]|uniref:uncharacterized protein LOC108105139 n=1 Tax=Drosophila eugracilis TaxID=29029 RepID=UPI0007E760A8|nr:uncharacterized protein LOC108105139 [Drosophila eugracilis]